LTDEQTPIAPKVRLRAARSSLVFLGILLISGGFFWGLVAR
jgi:hypothetical protein